MSHGDIGESDAAPDSNGSFSTAESATPVNSSPVTGTSYNAPEASGITVYYYYYYYYYYVVKAISGRGCRGLPTKPPSQSPTPAHRRD